MSDDTNSLKNKKFLKSVKSKIQSSTDSKLPTRQEIFYQEFDSIFVLVSFIQENQSAEITILTPWYVHDTLLIQLKSLGINNTTGLLSFTLFEDGSINSTRIDANLTEEHPYVSRKILKSEIYL